MGSTHPYTAEQIREKFKFPENVKIILTNKLSEVAPCGFTCITTGQLEAGLKIPLYDPDRPLQYEVLSLLSKAPGQMTGNSYRIIEEFENYNKEHPESKFSAKQIIELHYVRPIKNYPRCFSLRKKPHAVLRKKLRAVFPYHKTTGVSSDLKDWHKFPIFISGRDWIHLPGLPPPKEKYFDPIIWRFNNNEEETTVVLSSDEEESSPDENLPVSKHQKKDSEAGTQVGIGSSNGIEVACDRDPFQRLDTAHTTAADPGNPKFEGDRDIIQRVDTFITDQGNLVDNGNGPWFKELEGESEHNRIRNWEGGLIHIGNFPVEEKFAALYRKIWQRHGHLATRDVIKKSTFMLMVAVSELLESISAMATLQLVDIDDSILHIWDGKIADAEGLNFNVGWLRKHFDEVVKMKNVACSLTISQAKHKKALNLALQRKEAFKVQLEELEQKWRHVNSEVCQHHQAISEGLAARERYISLLQKTFLHDVV